MKIQIEVELPETPAEALRQELHDLKSRIQQKIGTTGHVSIPDIAAGLDIWTRLQTMPDQNLRLLAERYAGQYAHEQYATVINRDLEQLRQQAEGLKQRIAAAMRHPSSSLDTRQSFLKYGGKMDQIQRIEESAKQAVERHTTSAGKG